MGYLHVCWEQYSMKLLSLLLIEVWFSTISNRSDHDDNAEYASVTENMVKYRNGNETKLTTLKIYYQ